MSTDASVRSSAEGVLQSLEERPGYCSCLAEVVSSKQADHSARWLATIQLKNTVTRHWRQRSDSRSISDEEKAYLRGKLLALINQEDTQIAVQIAVTFAKVARCDYPRHWPSLLGDLAGRVSAPGGPGALQARRAFLVLHHILKELSSRRLMADQRTFAEVAGQLFQPYWTQWCADTQALLAGLPGALAAGSPGDDQLGLKLTFERWLLELKGLRRMLMFGFQADARTLQEVPAVGQVAPGLLQALGALLELRGAAPQPRVRSQLAAMLDAALAKLARSLTALLGTHPWSLLRCGAAEGALALAAGALAAAPPPGEPGRLPDRLVVALAQYVTAVLTSGPLKGALTAFDPGTRALAAAAKGMAAEAQARLRAFWEGGRLQQLAEALVTRFLPLSARDLQEWEEGPEAFHHEAEIGGWEERPHVCAERLLMMLVKEHREELAPLLVKMLAAAADACPPGAAASLPGPRVEGVPAALLAKEAVYTAAGAAAYDLHDYIDFGPWLRGALLQELSDEAPAARPLRRRAAMLVGAWAPKLASDDRPAAYRALLGIMAAPDLALALAGVDGLRALVTDWDFDEASFAEFVGPVLELLARLLQGSAEYDTQLQAFSLFNEVIERLADGIRPYADAILQLLPAVWHRAEGQPLLRIQVLTALQRLLNVLGPESVACYPLLLPLLRYCTDIDQPEELNLLEDGLQLWLIALRNAPAPHPALLELLPHLAAIMDRQTEHVAIVMPILAAAALLGGDGLMAAHGPVVAHVLAAGLGTLNERGTLLVLGAMELVMSAFPAEAPAALEVPLQRLLAALLAGSETGQVIAAACGIFARLLLAPGSPDLALAFFRRAPPPPSPQAAASAAGLPNGGAAHTLAGSRTPGGGGYAALLAFVDLWLDRFDAIPGLLHRKLGALGLTALLALPVPALVARLELIAAHVTAVWFEVEGSDMAGRESIGYDYLAPQRQENFSADTVNSEDAEGETLRRRRLRETDPVVCLRLSDVLRARLTQAAAMHGPAFQAAGAAMDPALASQLQAAVGGA
ncbi:hypothetical protein WJX81_002691 [Elliptochloris bilobata]|uniref:Importin N-terminal domain-containing protein n=1 Tax=Elliptochloris bilobata TaxID=381761 RepID=A0AAW1SDR0_9CHLO